ncbi:MAG: polyisoprenoid-binding protein [Deltaproteobacteria bacterium]|nr:polyisoprenoid-binding protein [Deltaproteobacteria bacterium]
MKKIFMTILLAALAAAPALADNYTIDPSHSFPSFEINHMGFSTQRGRFNKTEGKATLDPAKQAGTVDITIDASSIDTGLAKLEEHLRAEDFFDVNKYPTLSFKSKMVSFNGEKPASIEVELTLHGVTRPVALKVNSFNCGVHPMTKKNVCGADAETTIKRSEFGMGKYVPAVSDDVRIIIQTEMTKH